MQETDASRGPERDATVKDVATAVTNEPHAATAVAEGSFSPEELRRRTLKGLRSTVIARPMAELVLMGSMVVLARLVSPADYGRFGVAMLVSGLCIVPLGALGVALVQCPTLTREHLQTSLALAVIVAVTMIALAFVAATVIVTPIFGARTAAFARLSSVGTLIAAFNVVPCTLLQRGLAIRRLAILDVSNSVAVSAVAIVLAAIGMGGYALVISGLVAVLVTTTVNWIWAPQPLPHLHRESARELLRLAMPQSATMISWVCFGNIDYAVVGARLGALQAGYYVRAYTIGVVYQGKVSQVLANVGFPMLSRTQSSEQMAILRQQMVRLLTVLMFPALVLLAVVAPVLVPWVFGPKWTASVAPTQILAIGGMAALVINAVGAVLMAQARPRALLGYGWGHFASYTVVVFAGSRWGIVGVSVAAALDHTAFLLIAYAMMLHPSGQPALRSLWEDIGPATTCCLALVLVGIPMSLAVSFFHAAPVPYLAAVCSVSAAAYMLTLRIRFPDSWRMMCLFGSHVLPQRPLRSLIRSRVTGGIQETSPVAGGG